MSIRVIKQVKYHIQCLLGKHGRLYLDAQKMGLFDPEYYSTMYPDAIQDGTPPLQHYRTSGWKDGNNPSLEFSNAFYTETYKDQLTVIKDPLLHYMKLGMAAGNLPRPDCAACNDDSECNLPVTGYVSKEDEKLYLQAISQGDFDPDFYRKANPEVEQKHLSAIIHYQQQGWKELCNPSAKLDLCWYTQTYLQNDYSQDALLHYITKGRAAGYHPLPPSPVRFNEPLSYAKRATPLRRICLFAGYDVDGIVDDYVIEFVTDLARFCDVYYLADRGMRAGELDKLSGITKGAWALDHKAFDIGSWAILARELVGWEHIDSYDELLLVNDSTYLVRPLDDLFATMDQRACDWWGLQATKGTSRTFATQGLSETVSMETIKKSLLTEFEKDALYDFHIGQYFVAYRKPVFSDESFRSILNTVEPDKSKLRRIRKYEIGMTRFLIAKGHEFSTFVDEVYPWQPVYTDTIFDLVAKGFPLFKRFMLSENHYSVPGLGQWTEKLRKAGIHKDLTIYEDNALRACGHDKLFVSFNLEQRVPASVDTRALDQQTPKHDNWWAFPVCAFTSRLDDNSRALFEFVKDDPSIKKIILTRRYDLAFSGENVVVAPLISKVGLEYLMGSRFIFLKHSRPTNIPYPIATLEHAVINLWHGIPFKRIHFVSHDQQDKQKKLKKHNNELTSVICASNVDKLAMTAAFWPLTYYDIWLTGLPRHDFITCEATALPAHLAEQFSRLAERLAGRRLVLFVPTFKNDQTEGYYRFSPEELHTMDAFLAAHNLVLGIREHMADRQRSYSSQLCGDNYLHLSLDTFPDVEVLYRHASALVTDYSSAFIDFLLTNRPVISFAYDFEHYSSTERGLFYDMEWAFPGAIAKNFEELMTALAGTLEEMSEVERALYEFKKRIFIKYTDSNNASRVYKKVMDMYGKPDLRKIAAAQL